MTLILTCLLAGSNTLAVVLLGTLLRRNRQFSRYSVPPLPESLNNLPTVSVCIPARNETHAMTQCLERVIASSYPKLEIIVLDDESVDNTSILIKSFAHAGVRFVEGAPLPEGWLGKNHAEHELYREASGEFIIYLDVDTHLSTHSIDNLVALALAEKAEVVSVLPTRDDAWRGSVLFATLRHFWTVVTHTRRYPATASSVWMVRRELLKKEYDGLAAVRTAVQPEQVIATRASWRSAYRFFISNASLGVSYEKKWRSQLETSVRLLYPFFGASVFGACFGLAAVLILLLPFIVSASALVLPITTVHVLAFMASALLLVGYMFYTARVWRSGWLAGGILFPVVLVQEAILIIASVYAYGTKRVTWKGRPIHRSAARNQLS